MKNLSPEFPDMPDNRKAGKNVTAEQPQRGTGIYLFIVQCARMISGRRQKGADRLHFLSSGCAGREAVSRKAHDVTPTKMGGFRPPFLLQNAFPAVARLSVRSVVSRKKRGFFAHFRSGGTVPPPRILLFSQTKCSRCCVPIGCSPFPHSVSWKLPDKPTSERGKG